jgi:hypothetical protein
MGILEHHSGYKCHFIYSYSQIEIIMDTKLIGLVKELGEISYNGLVQKSITSNIFFRPLL